jgi:uncharacterized RDD family membrane protein YckC
MSHPATPDSQGYAGERLGLPEEGPGSVAGWGKRLLALFVDWISSLLVTQVLAASIAMDADTERALPLLVFLVQVTLFTALVGGSFGQVALRIAVVRLDRRPLTLLSALLRTFLICLVLPPLVFNRDNRGLHDLAVGTIAVNR